ncbi:unnamed protein product [Sympodiomycopsis kandeliae]
MSQAELLIQQQQQQQRGQDPLLEGQGDPVEEEEDEEQELEEDEEELQDPEDMFNDDNYDSDEISDSGTDSLTWISWFCSLPGHEYFAEVSEEFIEDDFNLTGLNALVPFYKEALEMILDVEPQEDSLKIPDVSIVESSAELLYGLIHQRYILTKQGLQQMLEKYEAGHFGYCPRVFCHSHPVLPCGRSDLPGLDTVKLFCANCIDCYAPPSSRFHGVDGAFFGTTFPHLLFQCYRDIAPSIIAPPGSNANSLNLWSTSTRGGANEQSVTGQEATSNNLINSDSTIQTDQQLQQQSQEDQSSRSFTSAVNPELVGQKPPHARLYTPRIYGFRVSEMAKSGPRMRWLRMRPESWNQLQLGIAPRGGGAPERQGSGAINVAVETTTTTTTTTTTNAPPSLQPQDPSRPIAGRRG